MELRPVRAERRRWTLRHQGDRMTVAPWISGRPEAEAPGSLLGTIEDRSRELYVAPVDAFWAAGAAPAWAEDWGTDQLGRG
jgi:hypothetical protein